MVDSWLGMMAGARTGVFGGQEEVKKIIVCAGSEVVLVETEETGSGAKRRVLKHQRGSKTDPETGTGAEIRQCKVVTEIGAVVRGSGWWLITITTTTKLFEK